MTNEEIWNHDKDLGGSLGYDDLLNLARQDERERMTEEKVKEYFAGLNNKETALIVLNYLLRGGITDDDLRGLRLQWIKDEREKMQSVEVWVSVDARRGAVVEIHTGRPTHNNEGIYHNHHDDSNHLLKLLKLQRGQCKKFKIVGVVSDNK